MTDNTSLMSKFAETPFSGNNKSPPGSWSLQNKDILTDQQQGIPNQKFSGFGIKAVAILLYNYNENQKVVFWWLQNN